MSARYTPKGKKNRLVKKGRQSRWAPFWTVTKIYGVGRKVHMGRHTVIKRSWKRGKRIKA